MNEAEKKLLGKLKGADAAVFAELHQKVVYANERADMRGKLHDFGVTMSGYAEESAKRKLRNRIYEAEGERDRAHGRGVDKGHAEAFYAAIMVGCLGVGAHAAMAAFTAWCAG